MKSISQFRGVLVEEPEYSKFDILVRAGLANKAQLQRLHGILAKMGEDKPTFNMADRLIIQNLFNRMVDLLSGNKQIFTQARKAVREDIELDEAVKSSEAVDDIPSSGPPMVLVLKRKFIRNINNNIRIALYYNDKLKKYFSVPYTAAGSVDLAPVQSEEVVIPDELMSMYEQLDENNQSIFLELIQDENNHQKLLDFYNDK